MYIKSFYRATTIKGEMTIEKVDFNKYHFRAIEEGFGIPSRTALEMVNEWNRQAIVIYKNCLFKPPVLYSYYIDID